MFRSLCVFSLIAFSACAVNADMSAMAMSFVEQAKEKGVQCISSLPFAMEDLGNTDKVGEQAKCFLGCVTNALSITNEDGTLNQALPALIPDNVPFKNIVETVFKDCANKTGKDRCETAFNTLMCITHDQVMKSALGKMMGKMQRLSKMVM